MLSRTRGMSILETACRALETESARAELRRITREHGDLICRTLRRLGVPESTVDDAAQQVFLTAIAKLDTIAPGSERSFIFGIAVNVASRCRQSVARRREVSDSSTSEIADQHPSPEERINQHEARALLDAVLDEMPDELRVVFVLFELEEESMAKIAELLQLPPGTVASRLRRARELFHASAQRLRARSFGPRGAR